MHLQFDQKPSREGRSQDADGTNLYFAMIRLITWLFVTSAGSTSNCWCLSGFLLESHVHQTVWGGRSRFCWLVVQNHGAQPAQYSHTQHWVNRPESPRCISGSCLDTHAHAHTHNVHTQAITHIGTFSFSSWVKLFWLLLQYQRGRVVVL